MSLMKFQKKAENYNLEGFLKKFIGQTVPVSSTKKIKVKDVKKGDFSFERDLSEKESSYFITWLRGEIQDYTRKMILG